MKRKKPSRDEFEGWLAHLDANHRRVYEIQQRAVERRNANLPPGAEPWPDRVPAPGRHATTEHRRAWNAQVEWDIRLARGLAEQRQAELDRKKRESDAA
jgi:hypothetical protein